MFLCFYVFMDNFIWGSTKFSLTVISQIHWHFTEHDYACVVNRHWSCAGGKFTCISKAISKQLKTIIKQRSLQNPFLWRKVFETGHFGEYSEITLKITRQANMANHNKKDDQPKGSNKKKKITGSWIVSQITVKLRQVSERYLHVALCSKLRYQMFYLNLQKKATWQQHK